ncbi:MAG: autotransporter-associated beta strand repeat-containing protein [Pirellulales bacterium]
MPVLVLGVAARAYDLHFDYTSFESTFGQAQFNVLNYPSINGNYMMTSTDNHRPEMVANGNALAEFYNFLNDRYDEQTVKNGAAAADAINQYTVNNSARNGPRPNWLILNEISPSRWSNSPGAPSLSTYRTWLIDCVTRLHEHYGYDVITLAPFQNPAQNNASWQALAEVSYVGIECYLSGTEVWNSGTTNAQRLAWAQSQYQASKNSYLNRGVPASRLFVTEHFASNNATFINGQGNEQAVGWGRAGLASASDWDTVIQLRQDAILNVGFPGFLAYNWGGNAMGITLPEQIQHEYYYRTRRVLASQQPQWLSDSAINVNGTVIPLSWSHPLNWLGGVPNTNGAVVNFWPTNTASRTITLDGTKTVGTLTFTSPFSYTISPGTGGSLMLNNSSSAATLISNQGNHNLGVGVQLTSSGVNAAINTGTFTISGIVSGGGGVTKSGAGTLALTAANSYTGETTVQAGILRMNSPFLADAADVYLSTGGTLNLNFTGSPDIIDSLFINGVSQAAGLWGAVGSGAQYISALITGAGRLQVTTFIPPPIVGDYNVDGLVDAADYLVWRGNVGAGSIPNRDPNNTGVIGQADYHSWRAHFGQTAGSGSAAPSAVPEPAGSILAFIAMLGIALWKRPERLVTSA